MAALDEVPWWLDAIERSAPGVARAALARLRRLRCRSVCLGPAMAQDSGLAETLITPVGWRAEPTGDGLRRVDPPDGSFHLRAAEDIPIGARYIDGESTRELVKYGGFVDRIEMPRTIRFTAEAPDVVWNGRFLTPNGTQTTVGVILRQTEVEPIASVTMDTVRLEIDNAPGGSGRPHYYGRPGCPCNFTTGVPYVFGTLAGWNAATNRVVGPKIWPIWVNITLTYD